MLSKKIFALLTVSLAVAACDTTDSGKHPTEAAAEAASIEKPGSRKPDAASEENCQAYFKEVAQICHESIYDGLDISCNTAMVSAGVAFSQQKGELFTDPNGNVTASEMGNALCAANLKSLRKKRDKAATEPNKDWGPNCTSFMENLESSCITPITKGDFGNSCSMALSKINSLKRNESPESLCKTFSGMIPE